MQIERGKGRAELTERVALAYIHTFKKIIVDIVPKTILSTLNISVHFSFTIFL